MIAMHGLWLIFNFWAELQKKDLKNKLCNLKREKVII
jgi:hypothetical protein